MKKHLTKRLVDHRRIGLASQAIAELALHHAESRFHVGTFVVMLDKLIAPET